MNLGSSRLITKSVGTSGTKCSSPLLQAAIRKVTSEINKIFRNFEYLVLVFIFTLKRSVKINIISRKHILILCFLFFIPLISYPQRVSREVKKSQKQIENLEEQQKKDYERARAKSVKHKFDMQDKKTQERMKASKKKADKNNKTKKTPFFLRPFKKRKAKKRW